MVGEGEGGGLPQTPANGRRRRLGKGAPNEPAPWDGRCLPDRSPPRPGVLGLLDRRRLRGRQ
ncbi:hypothetical protein chiPu_0027297, partial [Chiloscyllium punctatum]|nr:hypothetical protein [Chiloscyllium punctatum]